MPVLYKYIGIAAAIIIVALIITASVQYGIIKNLQSKVKAAELDLTNCREINAGLTRDIAVINADLSVWQSRLEECTSEKKCEIIEDDCDKRLAACYAQLERLRKAWEQCEQKGGTPDESCEDFILRSIQPFYF